MELLFREMTEEDLPAVLEIENASFTTPWTEDGFRSSMAQGYSLFLCAYTRAENSGAGVYTEAENSGAGVYTEAENSDDGAAMGTENSRGSSLSEPAAGRDRNREHLAGYCCALRSFDEAEIPDIAVAPAYRSQGIGRALLTELMRREKELGAEHFTLEVRKSNAPAIALYRSLGFEVFGMQKNFYSQPKEDALIMWRDPPPWLLRG